MNACYQKFRCVWLPRFCIGSGGGQGMKSHFHCSFGSGKNWESHHQFSYVPYTMPILSTYLNQSQERSPSKLLPPLTIPWTISLQNFASMVSHQQYPLNFNIPSISLQTYFTLFNFLVITKHGNLQVWKLNFHMKVKFLILPTSHFQSP